MALFYRVATGPTDIALLLCASRELYVRIAFIATCMDTIEWLMILNYCTWFSLLCYFDLLTEKYYEQVEILTLVVPAGVIFDPPSKI
jgi:hypothetical protein